MHWQFEREVRGRPAEEQQTESIQAEHDRIIEQLDKLHRTMASNSALETRNRTKELALDQEAAILRERIFMAKKTLQAKYFRAEKYGTEKVAHSLARIKSEKESLLRVKALQEEGLFNPKMAEYQALCDRVESLKQSEQQMRRQNKKLSETIAIRATRRDETKEGRLRDLANEVRQLELRVLQKEKILRQIWDREKEAQSS